MRAAAAALPAALLLSAAAAAEPAATTVARAYDLGEHGVLQLEVPASWKDTIRPPKAGRPPTLVFEPAAGDAFEVLITPLWTETLFGDVRDDAKLRKMIEAERDGLAPGAVESDLAVEPLKGGHAAGYLVRATQKETGPGEYDHVVRAAIGAGRLLLSATILSRSESAEDVERGVAMLRSAWYRAP